MKINPVTKPVFKSKLPPANLNINAKVKYTDAWDDFVCDAEKKSLTPEVMCVLDKISNDGNDVMLAFEKYTSECGIDNYYLGAYDNIDNLVEDKIMGNFLQNTINKRYIWFQKDSDGLFKIPVVHSLEKAKILGKTLSAAALKILDKITDKNSEEYKKIYGITSPEQLLRKYRAKI